MNNTKLEEAWILIDKLEKDNDALVKASRNANTALEYIRQEEAGLLERNRKLKLDNKLLRRIVSSGINVDRNELGQILEEFFQTVYANKIDNEHEKETTN